MKLEIVIPAHNEEFRIPKTLKEYLNFFNKQNLNYEIIVVLNATKDNTRKVVESFKSKHIKIIEFEKGGKGFAVIEGFKEALKSDAEFIGFVDADCSTPPEAFYDLYKNIGNYDGVIANRWDKRSKIKTKQTTLRRFLSRIFNFTVRALFLFNHRDTQCGAKLFRREILKKVIPKLGNTEWTFDVDMLFYMRREKAKILSIPTTWNDTANSKLNLKKTPVTILLSLIRLRLLHSPLRFMIRLYRGLPESWKIHKKF